MSVRDAVASQQGADETLLGEVDRYAQSDRLSDHQKAALRLADDYLVAPGSLSKEDRAELLRHLTPEQVVSVVLRLMQYSSDKVMVALGLDLEEVKIQPFTGEAVDPRSRPTKVTSD